MDRPIIMSTPMVRALIDGTKTQTRRVFKITGPMGNKCMITSPDEEIVRFDDGSFHYRSTSAMSGPYPCQFGVAGDTLWVRETFGEFVRRPGVAVYRADDELALGSSNRWRPSIHMPRKYSRIALKITDVRVERLGDISADDAAAEGWPGPDAAGTIRTSYPIAWYSLLWEQINGRGSWHANPWVWAIAFEVVK